LVIAIAAVGRVIVRVVLQVDVQPKNRSGADATEKNI
jgi:hypothetical protein